MLANLLGGDNPIDSEFYIKNINLIKRSNPNFYIVVICFNLSLSMIYPLGFEACLVDLFGLVWFVFWCQVMEFDGNDNLSTKT